MDTVRKVGLVGLGVVFFVFLVSANAAVALDRTWSASGPGVLGLFAWLLGPLQPVLGLVLVVLIVLDLTDRL